MFIAIMLVCSHGLVLTPLNSSFNQTARHSHKAHVVPEYDVIDLGYSASQPLAINDTEQIVGWISVGQTHKAFLWTRKKRIIIEEKQPSCDPSAINNNGVVVGTLLWNNDKTPHAFRWNEGNLHVLQPLPYDEMCSAAAVNDLGLTVGTSSKIGQDADRDLNHACMWRDGKAIRIPTFKGRFAKATGVNNSGVIVGTCETENFSDRAFIYKDGTFRYLDLPPRMMESEAVGINNSNEVIGNAYPNTILPTAFCWKDGHVYMLDTFAGGTTIAGSINDRGLAVGTVMSQKGKTGAFAALWENFKLHNLNDMVSRDAGWTLVQATGINNKAEIIGIGKYHGAIRDFLLIPTNKSERMVK